MDIALGPAYGIFTPTETDTETEINTDEMGTVLNEDIPSALVSVQYE